jgi:hypothetical protein
MANATTATKATSKAQPTAKAPAKATGQATPAPQANGHSQPATPPAKESRIVKGVIERYEHGQLISTEPAPKAATPKASPATPQAKTPAPKATPAKTPLQAPTVPTGPKPGEAYFIGKLGTEDLWQFAPISVEPGAAVVVRHFKGYELLSEYRRSAEYAQKLYRDLLDRSFVFIDGIVHKLMDEDL